MERKRFRRLVYADRLRLEQLLKDDKTASEIAAELGVHVATVYNELRRGGTPYSADTAQKSL